MTQALGQLVPGATTELSTRAFSMRASTVNEQARTVEAVLATEAVVTVLDPRSGELIDEVLLMSGARWPASRQVALLDTHDRSTIQKQLGSTREIHAEGAELIGRRHFSSVPEAQAGFTKIREGHLTDGSIGYQVIAGVRIEPGQSANVEDQEFTAGERLLQVATEWELREDSVLPIGADRGAKVRSPSGITIVLGKEMDMSDEKKTTAPPTEPVEQRSEPPTKVPVTTPATTPPAADASIAAVLEERRRMVLACVPDSLREFAEKVLLDEPELEFEDCRKRIAAEYAKRHAPVGTTEPEPPATRDDKAEAGEPQRMADVTDEMLLAGLCAR